MTICSVFLLLPALIPSVHYSSNSFRPFLKKGADKKDKAITRSGG